MKSTPKEGKFSPVRVNMGKQFFLSTDAFQSLFHKKTQIFKKHFSLGQKSEVKSSEEEERRKTNVTGVITLPYVFQKA